MLAVVPSHEVSDPSARRIEGGEGLSGKSRSVLEGPEDRFADGVVVAHPRPAEGRRDTEALERGEHRGALHWAAVVGVKDEPIATADAFVRAAAIGKDGGEVHRLFLMNIPAHDLATPDVEYQVEVIEAAAHRRPQIRNVPGPDLP